MSIYLPPGDGTIDDDVEVKRILMQLGVLTRVQLELSTIKDKPQHTYTYKCSCATHWLAIICFQNFPCPADNGFRLHAWDKATCSEIRFEHEIDQLLAKHRLTIDEDRKYPPPSAPNN